MNELRSFHVVTVGWDQGLIEGLCDPIARKTSDRFSHIVHPRYTRIDGGELAARPDTYFFWDRPGQLMPEPDHQLLASLEQTDVPTIHNMIMGDRIVCKIGYHDALAYATFLARKLAELLSTLRPSVVIGGFDALHGGIALAVARRMGIPWFALHFTTMPPGLACFCDRMSPAGGVLLKARPVSELLSLAEASLRGFENRSLQVAAYIAPSPLPLAARIAKLPARWAALLRTLRRSRQREFLRYTEEPSKYSVLAVARYFRRMTAARKAAFSVHTVAVPPVKPYVLFGLHMQPESSIDVWAPFFSNQMWVIELLSRSIPPTHKLLVKIHKSDIGNHSLERFERMCALPGVELVAPFADTRAFIDKADLLILIQGTMGLEAALLGKPVIMLGESAVARFPSVSQIGKITDLPALVRSKLAETKPDRGTILQAYAEFLAPYLPASPNNWSVDRNESEIDGYAALFDALRQHLVAEHGDPCRKIV